MHRGVLEEQVELWWFQEPRRSLACYCASVGLVLGCGLGGVSLLSAATGLSGEWRLGTGLALCLVALGVLLKQLLSSAVQDMNCIHSRRRIRMLKSGGLVDVLVLLLASLAVLIAGLVLLTLACLQLRQLVALQEMFICGVALTAVGGTTVLSVAAYAAAYAKSIPRVGPPRVFSVSLQMGQSRRANTASMAHLI